MHERIRVLLIEDDLEVTETIQDGLDASAFELVHGGSLAEGRRWLARGEYHVVVLDINLPDGSGLELADAMRRAGSQVSILMLTGKAAVEERVDGFRHGADDYLCKPFAVPELAARITALHRRARTESRHVLSHAGVELDLLSRRMRRGEIEATLSTRELELLAYFIRHPETVLTRESILTHIWGGDGQEEHNVLNVYVNSLRNKLEGGRYPRLIHTVRGVGLVFSATDPEEGPPVRPARTAGHAD